MRRAAAESRYCAQELRIAFLLFLISQAKIVAEHGLEQFAFPILKIADARWANRSKSGANFFNVRALAPDRQGEHLYHDFPQWLVTIVSQPI